MLLTNFFNKSKPINFWLVAAFLSVCYSVENFVGIPEEQTDYYFLKKLGFLIVFWLLLFLLDFTVKKNRMAGQSSFVVLLFVLFGVSFPAILKNEELLVSCFFVLLALRRTISLRSGIAVKLKILDASFWICIATLFFEWSILFFGVLFVAILFYAASDHRNWLIPLVAFFSVFVLTTSVHLLIGNSFFETWDMFRGPDMDFSIYHSPQIVLPLGVLFLFSIWVVANYFVRIERAPTTLKSSLVLILVTWIVAVTIVFLSATKDGSELIFFLVPTSIMGAAYFHLNREKRTKEIILWTLLVFAVFFSFFL